MAKRQAAGSPLIPIAKAAVRRIRLAKPMTLQELADATGFSKATLVNIEQGKTTQMRESNALKLAEKLGVRISAITSTTKETIPNAILGLMGLSDREQSFSSDIAFQDFRNEPGGNQALAYSWGDGDAQKFHTLFADTKQGERRLVAEVEGKDTEMFVNQAVQPYRQIPRLLLPDQTTLGFAARIMNNKDKQSAGLSLRLMDRKGRDWVYLATSSGYGPTEPHLFPLDESGKWTPCLLPLSDSQSEDSFWRLFHTTTSTRSVARPDFSVLARLVIQYTTRSDGRLTSLRSGRICISPIWLGSEQSVLKKLPTNHKEVLRAWWL